MLGTPQNGIILNHCSLWKVKAKLWWLAEVAGSWHGNQCKPPSRAPRGPSASPTFSLLFSISCCVERWREVDVTHLISPPCSERLSDVTTCSWQKEELCDEGPSRPRAMSLQGGNQACVRWEVPPCKALELLLVGKSNPRSKAVPPLSQQNGKTQMGLLPPSLVLFPREGF